MIRLEGFRKTNFDFPGTWNQAPENPKHNSETTPKAIAASDTFDLSPIANSQLAKHSFATAASLVALDFDIEEVPGEPKRLPHAETMPYYDQGTTSGCGTTSLAMIMTYLDIPTTQADVDKDIRRMDVSSSPNDIIEFARDHDLEAEGYNHGSWEEVKSFIDSGYPVEAMIQSETALGGSTDGRHYVVVTSYGTDPDTGEEYVLCHDPNLTYEQRIPIEDFKKMWGNYGYGYDNYFMAFGPNGANLPPGRDDDVEGILGLSDGATNICNGLNRIYNPDSIGGLIHGITQTAGAIPQIIGCGIGTGLQWGGQWLHDAVDGVPVLENLVQPISDLANGFGAAVSDVFNGFGEAADHTGRAIEDLFDGNVGGFFGNLGSAIGDIAGGFMDGVGDFCSSAVDAFTDLFSGW